MTFHVVIPSKTISNLEASLGSVFANEPRLSRSWIIVVDDGVEWRAHADLVSAATILQGPRVFCFSRNVNIGIQWAVEHGADGIIIMNDDATLLTPNGFTAMMQAAYDHPEYGVISAAITAHVGNHNQNPRHGSNSLRGERNSLAYVCVGMTRRTLDTIGLLDEDFSQDYGWEDIAHCREARNAGLKLGVFDGCLVEHGRLPSTFRQANRSVSVYNRNAAVFYRKYGDLDRWAVPPEYRKATQERAQGSRSLASGPLSRPAEAIRHRA